ncbi:MAG: sensor histidine kinase [Mesorhizobium sp.]|nr:MAG: sensor histidine kinase [Mesorhizobium sp.]
MAKAPHFDISAAVVRQLGEELVSDEVTAIIELVKNAYDADATFAHVSVSTTERLPIEGTKFPNETGYITIEDDGLGMDRHDIERGWLIISLSGKRTMKGQGLTTPKGRVPLGDKGLGRLSTQKLGRNLEMFTRKDGNNETLHVSFAWTAFNDDMSLSEVPVYLEPATSGRKKGTLLAISGLRNAEVWRGKAAEQLVSDLSQIISPFPEARPFLVTLRIDGRPIDLALVSERVRNAAIGRFRIDFDNGRLRLSGKVRLAKFRGNKTEDTEAFEKLLTQDNGKKFFEFLSSRTPPVETRFSSDAAYFLEFSHSVELSALGQTETDPDDPSKPADPGPFHSEIDEFSLRSDEVAVKLSGLANATEIQQIVKQHAGIKVFRDGFAIRPYGINGEDWLRLSEGQTSASSWYGLRPHNVIGFVAISEARNSQLREKTDREGFVSNPYSQNFRRLMGQAVENIATFYEWARRNYNSYKADYASPGKPFDSGRKSVLDAAAVSNRLANYAKRAASIKTRTSTIQKQIASVTNRIETTPLLSNAAERELSVLLAEARRALEASEAIFDELSDYAAEAQGLEQVVASLGPRLDVLSDQLQDFSELAGLGLLAETLSHEVQNQTDRLMQRASANASKARKTTPLNNDLLIFSTEVTSVASALRRQISHLGPSLRYQRDKVEVFSAKEILVDICDYFELRWRQLGISTNIEVDQDFRIRTNRGRLTQVIDNVLLNAEYWLQHTKKSIKRDPVLSIEIKSPRIRIWDNGLGVNPSVEDVLFEPFVTLKPKAQGRGLGLFISAQILESMGCSISLLGTRNANGHRYIFELDLSGVANG